MTTWRRSVCAGEIWLAYLRFSDKPDVGKVRPVLVVEAMTRSAVVIALKVTSKAPHDGRESMPLEDWEGCGLRRPSFVRLDQIFELSVDSLLRDEPLGTVGHVQLEEILRRLAGPRRTPEDGRRGDGEDRQR